MLVDILGFKLFFSYKLSTNAYVQTWRIRTDTTLPPAHNLISNYRDYPKLKVQFTHFAQNIFSDFLMVVSSDSFNSVVSVHF